jgi:glycosyltransferase involved in cell wall biosynthesis
MKPDSTTSLPLVSLVIPFHNEEKVLALFYQTLKSVLTQITQIHFEIVCVDDGSHDKTVLGLLALAHHDERVVVVELSRNYGKEAALTAGLMHARGEAAIIMDADLQDPPELIPTMIAKWRAGADMVLAKRIDRSADSQFKRWTSHIFYRLHNYVAQIKIPENVGDFRLINRAVIDAIMKLPERQRFMKGLFAWVGFSTDIVEYTRPKRSAGKTKFSTWKLWRLALDGIYSFSTMPLHLWTYFGTVCALLTGLYTIKIVVKAWMFDTDVPGYASIMVAIFFFGSVQLITLGVLGDYIGRIYSEVKQRPLFLIKQVFRNDSGSRK